MTSLTNGMAARGARYLPEPTVISVTSLLRLQGYRDLATVRADVRKIAEWGARRVEELSNPEVVYRRIPIAKVDDGSVALAGGALFHSRQFLDLLKGKQEVVAFILSLGPDIDRESMALLDRDEVVEALFLEYAGWIAIERATRNFAEHLSHALGPGRLRLTRRLAPGYHDWPLDEQRDFLALFAGMTLPVELQESCAMLPKKSRTGLYGLQPLQRSKEPAAEHPSGLRESIGMTPCALRRGAS